MSARLLVCSAAIFSIAFADTLTLRSGKIVQGSYLGGDSREIRMAIGDRVDNFAVSDVQSIMFDNAVAKPAPVSRYDAPPDRPRLTRRVADDQTGIEIPAGTSIVVSMIDSVDSEKSHLGQTFRASVDEPVLVNGETLIPRGADALAKLVEDKHSGKYEGRAVLTLDLMSVQVNGRTVNLTTTGVSRASGSRGARTAKVVGGTAAVGAIIGGIVGGGKGAAVGAGSGAAVGAGAETITSGQRVRIPSETRLTFTLQQPSRL